MQDVPKIVRQQLKASKPAMAESHPDADLLTAFAERSLAGAERSNVIEHLALCGDCRDVVALALPSTEAAALPASSGVRTNWFTWPVLRWAVVAAGLLTITSLGVLQYTQHHREDTVASNFAPRDAAASPAAQNAAVRPQAPSPQPNVPSSRMERDAADGSHAETTLAERKAAPSASAMFGQVQPMNRTGSAGTVAGETVHGAAGGIGSALDLNASRRRDSASAQPMQNAAPAQPQSPTPAPSQQVAAPFSSEAVEVQSEAAPVETQATAQNQAQDQLIQNQKELPLNGRNFSDLEVVKAKNPVPAQTAAAQASAPPRAAAGVPPQTPPALSLRAAPRWAISSAGGLQRSLDGGKTWEDINPTMNFTSVAASTTVESTAAADQDAAGQYATAQPMPSQAKKAKTPPNSSPVFRAVAAAGLEVWAGGSAGALYHTVDGGGRWTLVLPASAATILTGDITSIQFPDPQHGTVATSTAEVWTTADDGQTWHKQQ